MEAIHLIKERERERERAMSSSTKGFRVRCPVYCRHTRDATTTADKIYNIVANIHQMPPSAETTLACAKGVVLARFVGQMVSRLKFLVQTEIIIIGWMVVKLKGMHLANHGDLDNPLTLLLFLTRGFEFVNTLKTTREVASKSLSSLSSIIHSTDSLLNTYLAFDLGDPSFF